MFSNTKVIKNNYSSSIIVKFDEKLGISEFQLPVGFDSFPDDNYDLKKELFFCTYNCYRKFINEKKTIIENRKSRNVEKGIIDNDSVIESQDAFQFKDENSGVVLTYQKLVMFDSIIDAYDELRIKSLQDKISKSDQIDYSKIDKYMHSAIYLPRDVIYVDEMDMFKKVVNDVSTELVEMFCFIYTEILKELGEMPSNRVFSLANNFKEKRLFQDSSLFSESTHDFTLEVLKFVLDEIDQKTSYKDFDYWHFYDAIYNFIYSSNNGVWTLDNFSYIWERMCLAFANKYYENQIALFDNFGKLEDSSNQQSIKSFFKVSFRPKDRIRFIRPDLVLRDPTFSIMDNFLDLIYDINKKNNEFEISYKKTVNYLNYSDVDAIKKDLFKDKPNIKTYFERKNKFPSTFIVTYDEFIEFKTKARDILIKKDYFDLAVRQPNIITKEVLDQDMNKYLVVDFKYMNETAFIDNIDDQIKKAVRKQLVYELALKINKNSNTKSEFWIPTFMSGKRGDNFITVRKYSKNCDSFFKKYRISIIRLDFLTLQNNYIKNVI